MNLWVVNRARPSLWCRLLHRGWWFSNDFGMWWASKRTTFEIFCERCGGCWTEKHPLTGADT